jgi:alpha-ribazole phosphatase
MELLLLRHAETAGNLLKRYIGRTDEPLCDQGRARAKAFVRETKLPLVERVHVSPLLRARQTAELLFPQTELAVVEDLREMDFGVFEGRSAEDMAADAEYRAWVDQHCEPSCPQGESREEFDARTQNALHSLIELVLQTKEHYLVVVAHGGSLASVMGRWARPLRPYYQWFVPNCSGYYIRFEKNSWRRDGVFTDWTPLFSQEEPLENALDSL